MDQQSILKIQRPKFQLDGNDVDIRENAMLTGKHIQMAQELLHQQFPHIDGLLSPASGTALQFSLFKCCTLVVCIGCVLATLAVGRKMKFNSMTVYIEEYRHSPKNRLLPSCSFRTVIILKSSSPLLTSKRMEQTVVYLLSHLPQHSATS